MQVVDERWLNESQEPAALALRELRTRLSTQTREGKDKSWRLFHRVTYVSRVLEDIKTAPGAASSSASKVNFFDLSANWEFLKTIDPFVSGVRTFGDLSQSLRNTVSKTYPSLLSSGQFEKVLALVAEYYNID